MLTKLIFIITVIFSIIGVGKMFFQLTGLLENNGEILVASQEVNYISKIIYTDILLSGHNINNFSPEVFAAYLRKRMKKNDPSRDLSKDPWLRPYRLIVRERNVYEIRSAGPDLVFNTDDDIVAVNQY